MGGEGHHLFSVLLVVAVLEQVVVGSTLQRVKRVIVQQFVRDGLSKVLAVIVVEHQSRGLYAFRLDVRRRRVSQVRHSTVHLRVTVHY